MPRTPSLRLHSQSGIESSFPLSQDWYKRTRKVQERGIYSFFLFEPFPPKKEKKKRLQPFFSVHYRQRLAPPPLNFFSGKSFILTVNLPDHDQHHRVRHVSLTRVSSSFLANMTFPSLRSSSHFFCRYFIFLSIARSLPAIPFPWQVPLTTVDMQGLSI